MGERHTRYVHTTYITQHTSPLTGCARFTVHFFYTTTDKAIAKTQFSLSLWLHRLESIRTKLIDSVLFKIVASIVPVLCNNNIQNGLKFCFLTCAMKAKFRPPSSWAWAYLPSPMYYSRSFYAHTFGSLVGLPVISNFSLGSCKSWTHFHHWDPMVYLNQLVVWVPWNVVMLNCGKPTSTYNPPQKFHHHYFSWVFNFSPILMTFSKPIWQMRIGSYINFCSINKELGTDMLNDKAALMIIGLQMGII